MPLAVLLRTVRVIADAVFAAKFRSIDLAPATLKGVANLFDLDRYVIDKTGVKDRFAIHLEVETVVPGAPSATAVIKAFEQQLGLTLVSTKGKRSWVQVESIERPDLR